MILIRSRIPRQLATPGAVRRGPQSRLAQYAPAKREHDLPQHLARISPRQCLLLLFELLKILPSQRTLQASVNLGGRRAGPTPRVPRFVGRALSRRRCTAAVGARGCPAGASAHRDQGLGYFNLVGFGSRVQQGQLGAGIGGGGLARGCHRITCFELKGTPGDVAAGWVAPWAVVRQREGDPRKVGELLV